MSRGDYIGMICQTEVVIGTKIDDRMRFAVVFDNRARVGCGKHFRLIEFAGPPAIAHPFGKCGGSLKRILRFFREESC